jgi:hypothetical protein
VRVFDDHGADGAVFPEVHVGAGEDVLVIELLFVGYLLLLSLSLSYPQIPVLFTATVISPSLSASPFSTSSLLGDVSATQRSCSGLV